LRRNISTEFETGHFEPCTSLSQPITNQFDPADTGGTYNHRGGPYEKAAGPDSKNIEPGDALCCHAGDTHPGYDGPGTSTPPNVMTGCQDNIFQNGDLDFDGTPYYPEMADGHYSEHLPVLIRRTSPDDERPTVLGVLLPDRPRSQRVDLHGHEWLYGPAVGARQLLPVLDRAHRDRLLHPGVWQRQFGTAVPY
jgi:hypothetical protein